ncbi:MAG: LysR substrate-binding domain-containing protein [Gammaproteobacteria bacterium]
MYYMLDRFISMQVFLALVRRGTFAAAAAELGLSRAMASKHIAALEAHLGVRLFNRTTRSTRLTEAGEEYYGQIAPLLGEIEHIETTLGEHSGRVRGVLTVAAPPAYGADCLAPVIAAFMHRQPELGVRLTLADRTVDLVEENVDVAVVVGELEDSSYIARPLGTVRLIVCAAPAYFEQQPAPHEPADLAAHECLVYADASQRARARWDFLRDGKPHAIDVTGRFVCNVGNALRELAVTGRGIARLPDYMVRNRLASGELVEVLADYAPAPRPVNALYAHRERLPAKTLRFLEFAADRLGASPPPPR